MMIEIIKSYLTILVAVGGASLFFLIVGIYLIVKLSSRSKGLLIVSSSKEQQSVNENEGTSVPDIMAIAGDDVFATQLDLARAFIETGNGPSAKNILEQVVVQGNPAQQIEAQELLGLI